MAKSSFCFFISGSWGDTAIRKQTESLASALTGLGHRVVIILDHQQKDLVNTSGNPAFYTWPSYRPTGFRDAIFLWRLIRTYKPDCMISQFGSVNLMLILGALSGVPHRFARYHTLSTQVEADRKSSKVFIKFLRLRKRMIYKFATALLANSQSTYMDLVDVFKINPSKIVIFYNYLANPLQGSSGSPEVIPNRVVCVGRFNESKGQDVLINALAFLPDENQLEVEFVGEGETLEACKQMAANLGFQNRCLFIGSVNHSEVFKHFAQAEVSVVPSWDEAFGYVCIESLAVGTPVIGSRVGGIKEIVRDSLDGFLFTPGSPEALAEKLNYFFSSENDRIAMRTNARLRFLSTFEQDAVLNYQIDWLLGKLSMEKEAT